MAMILSPDLDALLLELRQTYIPQSQQQLAQPQQQQLAAQMQPQMQQQPMLQASAPQLPQAAPLQPMRQPMTASLSGLRPSFQVNPQNPIAGASQVASSPSNSSPLLAQRLQSFLNPGANSAMETAAPAPATNQPAAPGWGSRIGNAALGFAATPAGSSAIASGLGAAAPYAAQLGTLAAAHPAATGIAALGALGAGAYYYGRGQ